MIRILGTIFAALLGLAFGSFLNVCLCRWPHGESIVQPRSHCRNCAHALPWWENVPLLSWLFLRGRCSICRTWIGWRYPLVELAVGVLWAVSAWQVLNPALYSDGLPVFYYNAIAHAAGDFTLYWLLVALALLDAENLWLPDWITLPGIALGFFFTILRAALGAALPTGSQPGSMSFAAQGAAFGSFLSILACAALILLIRLVYWLVRRREGIGLGDAKLMALLAAWLGLPGALLAFGLGVVLGAAVALVSLAIPSKTADGTAWAVRKLPLGHFSAWGNREQLVGRADYRRLSPLVRPLTEMFVSAADSKDPPGNSALPDSPPESASYFCSSTLFQPAHSGCSRAKATVSSNCLRWWRKWTAW